MLLLVYFWEITVDSVYSTFSLQYVYLYFSRVMRKPDFCICENKDADQLCGDRTADQRLCFS